MFAKQNGVCSICKNPIQVGDVIGWTRRGSNAGIKYHSACYSTSKPEYSTLRPAAKTIVSATKNEFMNPLPKLTRTSNWWEVLQHTVRYLSRVLLIGPPGSGKSTTALKTCDIKYRITMTESTTREDMIGMFHLINGATVWVDGPVVSAMRQGVPILIDEIDRYSQEVASLLYSVLDDHAFVALPNGEIVNAQDGYKVLMTSNETPDMLPPAIFDRIEGVLIAKTPHSDAIKHLPTREQAAVRNFYSAQPDPIIKTKPTVRRMRAYVTLCQNGMTDHAAEVVFASSSREIESILASIVIESILALDI